MQYKVGDLTKAEEDIIAHGCNANGIMGAGVALAMKKAFPVNFKEYHKRCLDANTSNINIFGDYIVSYDRGKSILNLITHDFNKGSSLKAIHDSLHLFLSHHALIVGEAPDPIAIPQIGAGIGGLSWKSVEKVLLDLEKEFGMEFVVYTLD